MPADFDNCVKGGGRVRTKTLSDGKYMHVCFLNGKSHAGEVKSKQEELEKIDSSKIFGEKDTRLIDALITHEGLSEDEAVLSYGKRQDLPDTAFCGPDRSYPAHDIAHARNALARVAQFGNSALQARVRACVYRKFPELNKSENFNDVTFTESLTFGIQENSINEEKRTVRVCALAACISKNNRFYSPRVVESVSGTLVGKRSFADHDERDTKNLVGRIIGEEYKSGKLYADIRFSKSTGVAKETFEKIQDGTITDVSIAADGKTKRVKLGEQLVDEVTDLKIHSVDFVTEGGVQDAKVMQVFEDLNKIPTTSEVKNMDIKNITELRQAYPDLVAEIEKPLNDKINDMETKMLEKELREHKETEISKLQVKEEIKNLLKERVTGKTKEEITTSITTELNLVKKIAEVTKGEAKIEGVSSPKKDEKKDDTPVFNSAFIRQSAKIPEELKGKTIELLWNEGEKAAKEYLKTNKIEL